MSNLSKLANRIYEGKFLYKEEIARARTLRCDFKQGLNMFWEQQRRAGVIEYNENCG